MTIPLPLHPTTFERWTAELHLARPDIDIQPINISEKNWRLYVNQINQSSVCQSAGTPRPDSFKTWNEWAMAFIKAFGNNS